MLNCKSFFGAGSELETHFLIASWISGHFKEHPEDPLWSKTWQSFCGLAEGLVPEGFEGAGEFLARESDGTVWKGLWMTHLCDADYSTNDMVFKEHPIFLFVRGVQPLAHILAHGPTLVHALRGASGGLATRFSCNVCERFTGWFLGQHLTNIL